MLENGFADLQSLLKDILPKGAFSSLLIDGLIPGLSGVITFVPQIVLLFGFITILEDSGYMARIVFIMDSIMRKVGLNGKSVVPLMGSMACAVPAILANRTIENRKNRIITILVTPLMSCSARLPVYTLLIALAIPNKYLWNIISLQGLIMLFMYFLGFIAVMLSALIFKFFIKSDAKNYFVLELPNYRRPKLTSIMYSMYTKTKHFVISIGKVIIIVSIILWALSSYGPPSKFIEIEQKYKEKAQIQGDNLPELNQEKQSELLEHSYAGMLGKVIEPVIRPLGYDWKIGIALVASLAAREVFVGSMATIYSIGDADDIDAAIPTLEEKLKSKDPETGQYIFSPLVAISLMIFYAFAMQCASTLAVVYKETRSIKWPLIQFTYMTSLAYILSLIIYNLFL
ncbi:MAG: ferrous iron transporter B [Solitalea-like symbiont of Acarus siro]